MELARDGHAGSGIFCAAIMPHGFSLVPELSADAEGGEQTRQALREIGRRVAAAEPDVIVIATPHGFRVPGAICLADAARGAGTLEWNQRRVEQNVPIDRPFGAAIAREAERSALPLMVHGYAGEGADAVVPLDWGAMVPLWFLGHDHNRPGSGHVLADPPERDEGPPIVLLSPSPGVPAASLVRFGQVLAAAAATANRRVAFVASCDWSHTHRADGPYGFHPQAVKMDAAVEAAVRAGNLAALATLDPDHLAEAMTDGVPQALILAGVVGSDSPPPEVLSYEAPTYYGMLVAFYG